MWIILIKKLPVNPSPPRMSIFWSTPWAGSEDAILQQFERSVDVEDLPEDFYLDKDGKKLSRTEREEKQIAYMQSNSSGKQNDNIGYGFEHNEATSRRISYKGQDIRVFDDEFSVLTHANMSLYIGMTDGQQSHDLVPEGVAQNQLHQEVELGALREVYDAALVDGSNPTQAYAMALGVVVTEQPDGNDPAKYPATGWYRCRKEYAMIYCDAWELEE